MEMSDVNTKKDDNIQSENALVPYVATEKSLETPDRSNNFDILELLSDGADTDGSNTSGKPSFHSKFH